MKIYFLILMEIIHQEKIAKKNLKRKKIIDLWINILKDS